MFIDKHVFTIENNLSTNFALGMRIENFICLQTVSEIIYFFRF